MSRTAVDVKRELDIVRDQWLAALKLATQAMNAAWYRHRQADELYARKCEIEQAYSDLLAGECRNERSESFSFS